MKKQQLQEKENKNNNNNKNRNINTTTKNEEQNRGKLKVLLAEAIYQIPPHLARWWYAAHHTLAHHDK